MPPPYVYDITLYIYYILYILYILYISSHIYIILCICYIILERGTRKVGKQERNRRKNLRGGTRKVGKQERNRRKNEGERAGKKT